MKATMLQASEAQSPAPAQSQATVRKALNLTATCTHFTIEAETLQQDALPQVRSYTEDHWVFTSATKRCIFYPAVDTIHSELSFRNTTKSEVKCENNWLS